jgi:chemotaxis protein histidine kinase CheA
MYLGTAPDTFERMKNNLENESWHELAVNAHSIKPQADFMGISSLKEVLIDIENKVRINETELLDGLVEKAHNLHIDSEVPLRKFLENN